MKSLSRLFGTRYFRFSLGQAVSQLGNLFTVTAIGWLILDTCSSSKWLGFYLAYSIIIFAVLSLVVGRLLDKFPRKTLMLIADLAGFLSLAGLALCEAIGVVHLGIYFAVTFIVQFAGTVIVIGTQSVMGELGKGGEVARAQATFETLRRVFMACGPVLAGLALDLLPRWAVFAFDSGTYLIAWAVTATCLDFRPPSQASESGLQHRGHRLLNVLHPPVWNRELSFWVLLAVAVNLLYAPVLLLWPVVAQTLERGPSFMGLLGSAFTAGTLAGGIWIMRGQQPASRNRLRSSLILIATGFGILVLAPATGGYPWIYSSVAGPFILGLGFGSLTGPLMAVLHSLLPDEKKGAFFGWMGFVSQIAQPAILIVAGYIIESHGVWLLLTVMALLAGIGAYATNRRGSTRSDETRGTDLRECVGQTS